jgi:hypothetical protein
MLDVNGSPHINLNGLTIHITDIDECNSDPFSHLEYHNYNTSNNICYANDATLFKEVNINVTAYRFRSYLLLNHFYINQGEAADYILWTI